MPSVGDPLRTESPATNKQLLLSAKASPAPPFAENLWASTAEPGPPSKHLSQDQPASGKGCEVVHAHPQRILSRYMQSAQGLFHSRNFFPAVWKTSKSRHLSSVFSLSCACISSWHCFTKEIAC